MFAVDDDPFVVEFGDGIVACHDDCSGVVPFGVVPLFVERVNGQLNAVVEVRSVDDEAQANPSCRSILQRRDDGVLSPAVRPVHVQVLQRQQHFAVGVVKQRNKAADAGVGAHEELSFERSVHSLSRGADEGVGIGETPIRRAVARCNGNEMVALRVLIEREVLVHHGRNADIVNQCSPLTVPRCPRFWQGR